MADHPENQSTVESGGSSRRNHRSAKGRSRRASQSDNSHSSGQSGFSPQEKVRKTWMKRSGGVWGILGRLAVIVVLALFPWWFGGILPSAQYWAFLGLLVALVCWVATLGDSNSSRIAVPLVALPILGLVLLVLLQAIPLPTHLVGLLSPSAVKLRQQLIPPMDVADEPDWLSDFADGWSSLQTVSLYPMETRRHLALWIAATAAFFLGARFFSRQQGPIWLCVTLTALGAAVSAFGIAQLISTDGRTMFWTLQLEINANPFGPFRNRNHAGTLLAICVGAAFSMLLWSMTHDEKEDERRIAQARADHFPMPTDPWQQFVGMIAGLSIRQLLAGSALGLIVAGILCTLSRGTFLSVLGAGALVLAFVAFQRRFGLRAILGLVAVAGGLGLISWVGMGRKVQHRFEDMISIDSTASSRLDHWLIALQCVPEFFFFGSGLGTYRHIYGRYETSPIAVQYYYPENLYLGTLIELGLFGLLLALLTVVLLIGASIFLIVKDSDQKGKLLGVAGLFAFVSQAIHAFFDFGLYMPANAILLAVLAGAVTGRTALIAEFDRKAALRRLWTLPRMKKFSRVLTPVLVFILAAALWQSVHTVRSIAVVQRGLDQLEAAKKLEKQAVEAKPQRFLKAKDDVIRSLEMGLRSRWDHAEAHERLAELYIEKFRYGAMQRIRDEYQQAGRLPPSINELWDQTDLLVVHALAVRNQESGPEALEVLRREPAVVDYLRPALMHLLVARLACPLLPAVHYRLAELSFLDTDPRSTERLTSCVRYLSPTDPRLMFRVGHLDYNAGRYEAAWDAWKETLAYTDGYLVSILKLAQAKLSVAEIIEKVIPESPARMVWIARNRYLLPGVEEHQDRLLDRAEALLARGQRGGTSPQQEYYLRAWIHHLRGQPDKAIENLRNAVKLEPRNSIWRFELAGWLRDAGELEEAREMAEQALALVPTNKAYAKLVDDLNSKIKAR